MAEPYSTSFQLRHKYITYIHWNSRKAPLFMIDSFFNQVFQICKPMSFSNIKGYKQKSCALRAISQIFCSNPTKCILLSIFTSSFSSSSLKTNPIVNVFYTHYDLLDVSLKQD